MQFEYNKDHLTASKSLNNRRYFSDTKIKLKFPKNSKLPVFFNIISTNDTK